MNLKRCENEHFYDGDKFQSCPYCTADKNRDTQPTAPYTDMGTNNIRSTTKTDTVSIYQDSSLKNQDKGSLRDAVNKAVSVNKASEDDVRTISFFTTKTGVNPVVGWLVCIEGADFGKSFVIKCGGNFIGRAEHMDVVLQGDQSISREKHAIILYEPKRREFIAQAGESRELFYLNDEVVLNPVRLKQHDILTIGNTRLMFFPCCGEHFSWDDYKKDEEI